jgi:hypothetical protein
MVRTFRSINNHTYNFFIRSGRTLIKTRKRREMKIQVDVEVNFLTFEVL